MKIAFLEAARDDLKEVVRYYEARRPGLGAEFREEVRTTLDRIENLPDAWPLLGEKTRRCRTRRFPYGLIYQARAEGMVSELSGPPGSRSHGSTAPAEAAKQLESWQLESWKKRLSEDPQE